MSKKVISARGVVVDFDLLKVKQQIAESPAVDVSARENFVEKRLRRRSRRPVPGTTAIKPIVAEPSVDDTSLAEDASNVEVNAGEEASPVKKAPRPVKKGAPDA